MRAIDHPFLRGKTGICIMPVAANEHFYKPCGKMSALHKLVVTTKPKDEK